MRRLILVAFVLAGCAGTQAPEPGHDPDWSLRALAYGDGHDHTDPAHHDGMTTRNFQMVGHSPLESPYYGTTPGGYACGDAIDTRDGRRLAVVESRSDVGFAIADVTDPAAPTWLGELVMPTTRIYDLTVAPDGRHVVLVMSEVHTDKLLPTPQASGSAAGVAVADSAGTWATPCATVPVRWTVEPDPVPRPASVVLVDIQDPMDPQIVDQRPLTGLGHGAFATDLNGRVVFLVSSVAGGNLRDTYQFYGLIETPLGSRLDLMSSYVPERPLDTNVGIGGHTDGWIWPDAAGTPLAYVVGSMGLHVLDLSDPRRPVFLGGWTDAVPGRTGPVGNLHSVARTTELVEGRVHLLVGPEFQRRPDEQPSGTVWVVDATDPGNMAAVAAWTLPHQVEWDPDAGPYLFSNHYVALHGATGFVSMYHGGVWALDLSHVGRSAFELLPSIGVFAPTLRAPTEPAVPFRWTPTSQEVIAFPDGTLVTFDSNSGLYTFRFDASDPAPPPRPWPVLPID